MRRTEVLQGLRLMKFEDAYGKTHCGELSQSEAAEILGMSERTFRRWRDRFEADEADGLFPSSSDFSRTTQPVPPIWRRRGGVTGSSVPIAGRRESRSASPAGPASCAAGSATATPG